MKYGLSGAIVSLALLSGCGQSAKMEFQAAVEEASAWDDLVEQVETVSAPIEGLEPSLLDMKSGKDTFSCEVTKTGLQSSPEEFVTMDPDASIVWLGNLIQGRSHYNQGSLDELSVRSRAPMTISIDLLREDNARTVESPSLDTVQSAIGDLVDRASKDEHEASAVLYFDSREVHSAEQAMLEMDISGEYMGSSAAASFDADRSADEHIYMARLMQKAFTVSVAHPEKPSAVLSDNFSSADLQRLQDRDLLDPDNPPLYISSITYGRVLLYTVKSSAESSKVKAAIEASYRGLQSVDASIRGEVAKTLNNSEIEVAAFGGKQENIEALIRDGALSSYFLDDTRLTSMVPISFELRRLTDGKLAHITRTTEYEVRTCQKTTKPIGERVEVELRYIHVKSACDTLGSNGDIYGRLKLEWRDRNGTLQKTDFYNAGRGNVSKVKSGNNWRHNKKLTVDRIKGGTFKITGYLTDADAGLSGKDETVGKWDNTLMGGEGDGRVTGSGNCTGDQPVAHYSVRKLSDIYPQ